MNAPQGEMMLFDGYDSLPADPSAPALSADRRRTQKQAAQIAAGTHPLLAVAYGSHQASRLHEHALRTATPTDPRGLPFTCGTCSFRKLVSWHRSTYPKCVWSRGNGLASLNESPRVSHGTATDVRGWWPACPDYEAGDLGMGPDAMRGLPGGAA